MWCTAGTAVILIINITWIIWASRTYGMKNGIGTIQRGTCKEAKSLGLWLHLAINVLSTLLLAASNYCMQCLAAPTRTEVDKVHKDQKWLDIGVPSVRNLFFIARVRSLLWFLLVISSVSLHLLYNSAVFSTISAKAFNVYGVSPDVVDGQDIELHNPVREWLTLHPKAEVHTDSVAASAKWDRLNSTDCVYAYGRRVVSSHGDLIIVSRSIISTETSKVRIIATSRGDEVISFGRYWRCTTYDSKATSTGGLQRVSKNVTCGDQGDIKNPDRHVTVEVVANLTLDYDRLHVDYCLSERVKEECMVQFSAPIMYIVIASNVLK